MELGGGAAAPVVRPGALIEPPNKAHGMSTKNDMWFILFRSRAFSGVFATGLRPEASGLDSRPLVQPLLW